MATVNLAVKGGGKLQAHLAAVSRKLGNARGIKVGFLQGATYPNGLSVAQVAFWNEFGTIHAPPRPAFRRMIAKGSRNWGDQFAKILRATQYDTSIAFGLLGTKLKDELVGSINELTDPPLKPSTIRRKGFAKPLIDTAVMLRSPDYEVVK
jgi:hypothetical protein